MGAAGWCGCCAWLVVFMSLAKTGAPIACIQRQLHACDLLGCFRMAGILAAFLQAHPLPRPSFLSTRQVLLYTERAQFYNRHRIRGAKVGLGAVGLLVPLRPDGGRPPPTDRPA